MSERKYATIGDLDCITVDGGPAPRIVVVMCHGYGASREDLAPLADEWMSRIGADSSAFRFIFPDAPLTLDQFGMPGGRAWWHIDVSKLTDTVRDAGITGLQGHEPDGLTDVREKLDSLIQQIQQADTESSSTLVLGGFSQGAMLSMDVALRGTAKAPAALFQFSGTVVARAQWEPRISRLQHTFVFQSHGTVDPILPFAGAQSLHQMLVDAGITTEFHSFMGAHTIDEIAIEKTTQILESAV